MKPAALLRHGLGLLLPVLLPVAVASTIWLYLYPMFQQPCAFPLPPPRNSDPAAAFADTYARHWPLAGALPWASRAPADDGADVTNGSAPSPRPTSRPRAPFRLLALGDPQLEGDTSIPNIWLGVMPHLVKVWRHLTFRTPHTGLWQRLQRVLHDWIDVWFEDIPNELESVRKRIDLLGNDFYLRHVYRTLHWWADPTHVTVLGDLLGSQWIDDAEFDRRGRRFWDRVFAGAERVPDDVALYPAEEYDLAAELDPHGGPGGDGTNEQLDAWRRRLINVAGNHDIGYAGDINEARLERFERVFGKANYELRFELPVLDPAVNATVFDDETNLASDRLPPEIRVVVINDMNLDTPAISAPLQDATYAFLNKVIGTASAVEFDGHFTVVLTHIPLYKPAGVCVDAPFFDFFPEDEGGGVREQNQLSQDASKGFLEGVFGLSGNQGAAAGGRGRRGVLLNGHDHEGCDTYHFINQTAVAEAEAAAAAAEKDKEGSSGNDEDESTPTPTPAPPPPPPPAPRWQVRQWTDAVGEGGVVGRETDGLPGVREITVRSMMGDFGGYAGLLSLWFDEAAWEWRYEYSACSLGRPAMWWTVHITDLVLAVLTVAWAVMALFGIGKRESATATPSAKAKRAPSIPSMPSKPSKSIAEG